MIKEQILPADIQAIVDSIKEEKLILAEVLLPEIEGRPDYDQYLRVEDMNMALSVCYLKLIPKRILIHKVTKEELDDIYFFDILKWSTIKALISAIIFTIISYFVWPTPSGFTPSGWMFFIFGISLWLFAHSGTLLAKDSYKKVEDLIKMFLQFID